MNLENTLFSDYKSQKKVQAVGLEPTRISPFALKANALTDSAKLA